MQNFFPFSSINFKLSIILLVCISIAINCSAQYKLHINYIDKDSTFKPQPLKLQTTFTTLIECEKYIKRLPAILVSKGYAAVSIDDIIYKDSFVVIQLFMGDQNNWVQLNTSSIEKNALEQSGLASKVFTNKPFNPTEISYYKERILNYYEKSGYPFASVFLDSVKHNTNGMIAKLSVLKGSLYHIDSLSIKGDVKISSTFLQRYLGIPNGSIYSKDKLDLVSKRLLELPFLREQQPSELMMLGTGSVLNLYLQTKKSSQVNFLIGFLPDNTETGKLKITGDVNLNLKNTLGSGETILLNWQQLQQKSPRLNIGFLQPYIFKSPFGIDFSFELFKKDSAFVQLNAQLGIQYLLSANQSGKLFMQKQNTFLLGSGIDTNQIKAKKVLPFNIDVSAVNFGIDYDFNNTNYRLNPKTGNEIKLLGSIGIKTINKNNDILNLTDPLFNYGTLYDSIKLKAYQFRIKGSAAHYFATSKRSTVKTIVSAGIFNSPNIFRNELFQIGGYKLLRGFDEESIYATQYAVVTTEYRYLIAQNSYLFSFIDGGLIRNKYQSVNILNKFISTGIGLVFETKLGLLNLSFAIGKRNDVNFNLSQSSKIHFGYINYF